MSDALVHCIGLDGDMIVREAFASNVAQPGMVEVSAEIYEVAKNRLNLCKWDGTSLSDYTPPAPAPVIPQQVPMWAAQAALKQDGKYDAINAAIVGDAAASPPVPSMEASNAPVFFAWTMGNYASRQSAFIAALASQFDMASADIDAVFVAADHLAQIAG
ncbi:hypothetical protein [Methylobacterium sp. SI9]|uniref:hypothetical protein n=1 Tax=Methylobacterium guangdongense TaxID=3138811 RepID=UPI00313E9533